jgi:hypothetical protein
MLKAIHFALWIKNGTVKFAEMCIFNENFVYIFVLKCTALHFIRNPRTIYSIYCANFKDSLQAAPNAFLED